MLKIIIVIFLVLGCCLSEKSKKTNYSDNLIELAKNINEKILDLIPLLEQRPLIQSVSLKGGNFTLERKKFKYNPGKYLGDIQNIRNEPLPDEENGYFDLSDTICKYEKMEEETRRKPLETYVDGLENLLTFLNDTWRAEYILRRDLRILQKKYENTTTIMTQPLKDGDVNKFADIQMDIPVKTKLIGFFETMMGYITKNAKIEPVLPEKNNKEQAGVPETKVDEEGKKNHSKKNKKKQEKKWNKEW